MISVSRHLQPRQKQASNSATGKETIGNIPDESTKQDKQSSRLV